MVDSAGSEKKIYELSSVQANFYQEEIVSKVQSFIDSSDEGKAGLYTQLFELAKTLANVLSFKPTENWDEKKIAEITGKIKTLGEEVKKVEELEKKIKDFLEVASLEEEKTEFLFDLYCDASDKLIEIFIKKREGSELEKMAAITQEIRH